MTFTAANGLSFLLASGELWKRAHRRALASDIAVGQKNTGNSLSRFHAFCGFTMDVSVVVGMVGFGRLGDSYHSSELNVG